VRISCAETDEIKTYLLTLKGKSGKKYGVRFECEDHIDAVHMLIDCDISGCVDGEFIEEIPAGFEFDPEIPTC